MVLVISSQACYKGVCVKQRAVVSDEHSMLNAETATEPDIPFSRGIASLDDGDGCGGNCGSRCLQLLCLVTCCACVLKVVGILADLLTFATGLTLLT